MSVLLDVEPVITNGMLDTPCVNDDRRADVFVRMRCCPEAAYLCRPCLDELREHLAIKGECRPLRCVTCGHRWPVGSQLEDIATIEAAR